MAEARAVVANVIAAQPAFSSETVDAAMRYALEGGKGLRAFLVLEGARLHGVEAASAGHAAAAIECIHAYSLGGLLEERFIVQKLGDALQSVAFELILSSPYDDAAKVALCETLAVAARQMVEGQALDIAAESAAAPLNLSEIETLQALKTGALIRWSSKAGALLAGADPEPLDRYGRALGTAFQIADDILDVEGDEATAGKRLQKDAEAGKATFVSLLGLDGAKTRAQELVAEAIDALSLYSAQADYLRDAARFVISRDK